MSTKLVFRSSRIILLSVVITILITTSLWGTRSVRGLGILSSDNETGLEQVDAVGNGILQFKSGFESGTHITGEISTTSSKDGWIEGYDGPLGDWSSLKVGNYSNLGWVKQAYGWFQGGNMEIVQDPTGVDNQVLRLHNTNAIGTASRSQWELNQVVFWKDDGLPNQFTQQFYRYRMYIPSDISRAISYESNAPWYMIWESHTWPQYENGNLTRYGIYLQKRGNSNHWYFNAIQSRPEGCHRHYGDPVGCEVYWDNRENENIPVPFDEWFTFDVFFKYSGTDGEWFVAITREGQPRQVVAHYTGPTQFYGEKFHDHMIFKLYHADDYLQALGDTSQYYDDLEIWSDYPPGYFTPDIVTPSLTPTQTIMPTTTSISPTLPGLSWEAEQGQITAPFTVGDGNVSQNILTTNPADGGRALYRFSIQEAGDYVVNAIVSAADAASNSFFVGMDSEPDTSLIWDIVLTNGYEERTVSWREGTAPDGNASPPRVFYLEPGEHTLIMRGREANTLLEKVEVAKIPVAQPTITAPPTGTLTQTPLPIPPTLIPTNTSVPVIPNPTITPVSANSNSQSPLPGLSWEAEQGEVASPFIALNGVVSQSVLTDNPLNGGRALYRFDIQESGDYIVKAIVNAADSGRNSFFVSMDTEPDLSMIWDVIITNGFEERIVSWRVGAAPDGNASTPKIFYLTPGEHTLIFRGREMSTLLDKVEVAKAQSNPPTATPQVTVTFPPTPTPTISANPTFETTYTSTPTPIIYTSTPWPTNTPLPTLIEQPLDIVSPTITNIVNQDYTQLFVTFSEDIGTTGSNLANFSLNGANDGTVSIDTISYDNNSYTTTLTINGGNPLPPDDYILVVVGTTSITDLAGNKLDGNGDGIGGDDFVYGFSVQSPTTALPTETSILPTAMVTVTSISAPSTSTATYVPPTETATETPAPPSPTPTETPISPIPTTEPTSRPVMETIFDDEDSAFVYSSVWQTVYRRAAYNGSFKETTSNGADVTLNFTGQSFSIIYKSGREYRSIDVYLDGNLVGSINEQNWRQGYQQRWDYTGLLVSGPHTLKLVFVTENRKDKTKGSLDAVIIR